jgi:hypothetical protein
MVVMAEMRVVGGLRWKFAGLRCRLDVEQPGEGVEVVQLGHKVEVGRCMAASGRIGVGQVVQLVVLVHTDWRGPDDCH